MYLHSLHVKGFKRLVDVSVELNDATFLIGQNNSGKSSLLKAIEYLLSGKQIPTEEFHSARDEDTGQCEIANEEIEMLAEFRDVATSSNTWRGFAGRTFTYESEADSQETGISITYKKYGSRVKRRFNTLKRMCAQLKTNIVALRLSKD